MSKELKAIIKFGVNALSVLITAYLLPGVTIENFWTAVVIAAILGLLNAFIKPILIFLTIPVTIFTFGIFLLVINGFLIALTSEIVPGFHIKNFWYAMWFSIFLTIINSLLEGILGLKDNKEPENGA